MAIVLISNKAQFEGEMENIGATEFESTEAVVRLVSGLEASKVADKEVWADGELTYVITIVNDVLNEPFTGGSMSDTLNSAMTLASVDPVTIGGVPVAYDFTGNVLTIENLPTVMNGGSLEIVVKVVRV